jgi:hypothetical protein
LILDFSKGKIFSKKSSLFDLFLFLWLLHRAISETARFLRKNLSTLEIPLTHQKPVLHPTFASTKIWPLPIKAVP